MKKNIGLAMALAIALMAAGNMVPAMAQTGKATITFVNDTGADITEMVISPAGKQSHGNQNVLAIQDIRQEDGAVFRVPLTEELAMADSFKIGIVSGGKHFVTPREVTIKLQNGKNAIVHLAETEKKLSEGIANAGFALASGVLFATTKRMVPGTIAKIGVAVASKLGLGVIPYIGPILIIGTTVAVTTIILINELRSPGDLYAQVYYEKEELI